MVLPLAAHGHCKPDAIAHAHGRRRHVHSRPLFCAITFLKEWKADHVWRQIQREGGCHMFARETAASPQLPDEQARSSAQSCSSRRKPGGACNPASRPASVAKSSFRISRKLVRPLRRRPTSTNHALLPTHQPPPASPPALTPASLEVPPSRAPVSSFSPLASSPPLSPPPPPPTLAHLSRRSTVCAATRSSWARLSESSV